MERLKARLCAEAGAGRLSHCYLLCGGEDEDRRELARFLSAAAQCEGQRKPCGNCLPCRKVQAGIHPDVAEIDDPERKQIPVELVRSARSDMFIRPNEGRRKVQIYPRAQDLNPAGQNALLKLLEEPPPYALFLLLSDTAERLLPTIRSRAVELRLTQERETTPLPQTAAFAKAYAQGDTLALLSLFCSMEKLGREPLSEVLTQFRRLVADALLCREGVPSGPDAEAVARARTARQLLRASEALEGARADLRSNVNTATICAALFAQLRSLSST